jgi:hypothetical protein
MYGPDSYGTAQAGGYGAPAHDPAQAGGYGAPADSYGMGSGSYGAPAGNDAFGFAGVGSYGNYGGAVAGGYGEDPQQGSSPSLIGRPPLARNQVTPTLPCPNCGELVTENALSCPRCDYRFYAPCPNCGEYVDTSDPSPSGKDVCPHCSQPVDKVALGRSGPRIGQSMNPRDAMMAATRQRKAQEEAAAVQAAAAAASTEKKKRAGGAMRTLVSLALLVALLAVLYFLYQLGVLGTIWNSLPANATPIPSLEPTITPGLGP